jgi:hypothetical protein
MSHPYTVVAGDTLTRIAQKHGVPSWREIYYAAENAAFRRRRPDPNRIFPGDVVIIPSPWGDDIGAPPPHTPPRAGLCRCDRFGGAPPLGYEGVVPIGRYDGRSRVAQFQAVPVPPPAAPPASPPVPSPREAAIAVAPQAFIWVGRAVDAIGRIQGRLRRNQPVEDEGEAWLGIDISFRIGSIAGNDARIERLEAIRQRYVAILRATSQPQMFFAEDLVRPRPYAEAQKGGIEMSGEKITFLRPYVLPFSDQFAALQSGPIFRITVMIHEGAHFSHRDLGHVADPTPPPDGANVSSHNPYGTAVNWTTMTADMALNNAYSYAQYCLHLEKGADFRLQNFAL